MKIFLDSIGCRLNQSEIERFAIQFRAAGHTIVNSAGEAELVVVNTCTVTGAAASDSRQKIRHAARAGAAVARGGGRQRPPCRPCRGPRRARALQCRGGQRRVRRAQSDRAASRGVCGAGRNDDHRHPRAFDQGAYAAGSRLIRRCVESARSSGRAPSRTRLPVCRGRRRSRGAPATSQPRAAHWAAPGAYRIGAVRRCAGVGLGPFKGTSRPAAAFGGSRRMR